MKYSCTNDQFDAAQQRTADALDAPPADYEVPDGWSNFRVLMERRKWNLSRREWPIATAGGVVLWGVPLPKAVRS